MSALCKIAILLARTIITVRKISNDFLILHTISRGIQNFFTCCYRTRASAHHHVTSKTSKDVSDRKVRAAIAELIRIVLEKKRGDSDVVLRTPKSASPKKKKRGARTPLPSPPPRPGLCAPVETGASSESVQVAREAASADLSRAEPAHDGRVLVALRERPFLAREKSARASCSVSATSDPPSVAVHLPRKSSSGEHEHQRQYSFDKVFGSFSTQEAIYREVGAPIIQHAHAGYNCSVIAYGQTGSGKTYTVMGPLGGRTSGNSSECAPSDGLIPRRCLDLFRPDGLFGETDCSTVVIKASYVELYNETIQDLLAPEGRVPLSAPSSDRKIGKEHRKRLVVRELPTSGVYIDGLTHHLVTSVEEVNQLLADGAVARAMASTRKNATSSRSHTIFTLSITQETDTGASIESKTSRIRIVDLAGSESAAIHQVPDDDADINAMQPRGRSRSMYAQRIKETSSINKSLFMLGRLISMLSSDADEEKERPRHMPYRSSTLTWILKDSLGGNALTSMIVTVSPAASDVSTSITSLAYAERCKTVKTKPTANIALRERRIEELQAEIASLKEALRDSADARASADHLQEFHLDSRESARAKTQQMRTLRRRQSVENGSAFTQHFEGGVWQQRPHLVQITEDPMLVGAVIYALREGKTALGRAGAPEGCDHDIRMEALGVRAHHCTFTVQGGKCRVEASCQDGILAVNGKAVPEGGSCDLKSGAIVVIGSTAVFAYRDGNEHPEMLEDLARVHYGSAIARVLKLKSERDAEESKSRRNTGVFTNTHTLLTAAKKFKRGLSRSHLTADISGALDDASDVNEMLREMARAASGNDDFVVRLWEMRAPIAPASTLHQSEGSQRLFRIFESLDPGTISLCMVATDVVGTGTEPVVLFTCSMDVFENALIFELQKLHERVVWGTQDAKSGNGGLLHMFIDQCRAADCVDWTQEAKRVHLLHFGSEQHHRIEESSDPHRC